MSQAKGGGIEKIVKVHCRSGQNCTVAEELEWVFEYIRQKLLRVVRVEKKENHRRDSLADGFIRVS
jgi:hypothetical protein